MADTAHKTKDEKKEFFDDPKVLDQKITLLADLIKKSKHFTAFTGAGISTSTGIPDFRSGTNTVLATGPGCWEKKAQGIKENKSKKLIKTSMLKAIPSKTHMALVQLEKAGFLKHLISQNVDGLHRRSGFPPEKFSELHGNTNLEKCKKCKKQYMRDFRVRTAQKVHDHKTGRQCENEKCKGDLYDSIINFGESLPEKDMNDGFQNSEKSDLQIVLGSSLRVTPAADMPAIVGKKANLVIVNLQSTPLDSIAGLRINGLCDDVMEKLMVKLGINIPQFTLQRRVKFIKSKSGVKVQGVDSDGSPYQLFQQVVADYGKNAPQKILKGNSQLFPLVLDEKRQVRDMNMKLEFYGHYNEESMLINLKLKEMQENSTYTYFMEFNPMIRKWINCVNLDKQRQELDEKENLQIQQKIQNAQNEEINQIKN